MQKSGQDDLGEVSPVTAGVELILVSWRLFVDVIYHALAEVAVQMRRG